jgi:hypothetical protein
MTVQQKEIWESKVALEGILQDSVTSFAYPFGDYHEDTPPLVRDAGFSCACTTAEHTLWRRSDPFQIPRLGAPNLPGSEFEDRLAKWFHD